MLCRFFPPFPSLAAEDNSDGFALFRSPALMWCSWCMDSLVWFSGDLATESLPRPLPFQLLPIMPDNSAASTRRVLFSLCAALAFPSVYPVHFIWFYGCQLLYVPLD